jgi:acyl carrier protein
MPTTARTSRSNLTVASDAESRLASVFAEVLGLPRDRIHHDLAPGEVERWDSVGHVMLVTAIEQEFSIQFEVDEIMEFTNFEAILSAVAQRIAA